MVGVHHGTARLRGVGAVGRFAVGAIVRLVDGRLRGDRRGVVGSSAVGRERRLRGVVRELDGGLFVADVDESHEGIGVGRGQRPALFAHRVAHGLDGNEDALGFVGHQGDDDLDGAVAAGAQVQVAGVEGAPESFGFVDRLAFFGDEALLLADAAADAFELGRRRVAGVLEESVLHLRRGDADDGAHLGVRELASAHGVGELREVAQRVRDAESFAGGVLVHADAPREPRGAGGGSGVGPVAAVVELADQDELSVGRGVEMRGEGGELFFGGCGVERLFLAIGGVVVLVLRVVFDVEHAGTIACGCDIGLRVSR